MANLIIMLLRSLLTGVQSQAVMRAEIIALRHQLIVLQRTQKTNRLILGRADRCLWVWLSRLWLRWRPRMVQKLKSRGFTIVIVEHSAEPLVPSYSAVRRDRLHWNNETILESLM